MSHTSVLVILLFLVFLGALPASVAVVHYLMVGIHFRSDHLDIVTSQFPRVAILVPAWNEAAVLTQAVQRLLDLDYPKDCIRVIVVDDASTDDTPAVVAALVKQSPSQVVHIRRDQGGQGKAHTLNVGLEYALSDDWAQAVMIMDADVIFERTALRRMTRHFADPNVGAVTGYIQEGSRPGNWMTRSISVEYATAQAVGRRAQNVVGPIACLAGGAQLHTRESLQRIGGRIDTTTLAEDTVTTLETQLAGAKVIFDPHALVLAEEPGSIEALWKQRLRWGRGNLQVASRYRKLWFRPSTPGGLGRWWFGITWFSLLLQAGTAVTTSMGLTVLYLTAPDIAWDAFLYGWVITLLAVVLTSLITLLVDTNIARRCIVDACLFPGLGNLAILLIILVPHFSVPLHLRPLLYAWPVLAMVVCWIARYAERAGWKFLAHLLVIIGGYGSLLSAININAYLAQIRNKPMTWEKTEKVGRMSI